MIYLDRNKLEKIIAERGENLSDFAKECGISRQSLYNMFEGKSVISTPLEKIFNKLNANWDEIIAIKKEDYFKNAPQQVKLAFAEAVEFVRSKHADLFLIGSRARGKGSKFSDWDLAIHFPKKFNRSEFINLKEMTKEHSFPYYVDIVLLNDAPEWFIASIEKDAIRIEGNGDLTKILKRCA